MTPFGGVREIEREFHLVGVFGGELGEDDEGADGGVFALGVEVAAVFSVAPGEDLG